MRRYPTLVLGALVALALVSCASSDSKTPGSSWLLQRAPTQQQVDAANQICERQVEADRLFYSRTWFTNWLKCKQAHVMPLEMKIYPGQEEKIREMYTKLIAMGAAVDTGESRVEPVYDEWDRMQAEIGYYKGLCVKNPDGSQRCINPGDSNMFYETATGEIIPLD